mmetsp:Transcript_7656/g.16390  ORF Transcript_7656/g.16390 Transcript_7656/m.16390 type:complete len:86 (-) Transcript_7656:87-344(-)
MKSITYLIIKDGSCFTNTFLRLLGMGHRYPELELDLCCWFTICGIGLEKEVCHYRLYQNFGRSPVKLFHDSFMDNSIKWPKLLSD